MLSKTRGFLSSLIEVSKHLNQRTEWTLLRNYSKKCSGDCSKAFVDIAPDADKICPQTSGKMKKKKEGILHKIKLKVIEGGTNFGSKFDVLYFTPLSWCSTFVWGLSAGLTLSIVCEQLKQIETEMLCSIVNFKPHHDRRRLASLAWYLNGDEQNYTHKLQHIVSVFRLHFT